eukprot:1153020-Rhodomonas_salina.1
MSRVRNEVHVGSRICHHQKLIVFFFWDINQNAACVRVWWYSAGLQWRFTFTFTGHTHYDCSCNGVEHRVWGDRLTHCIEDCAVAERHLV